MDRRIIKTKEAIQKAYFTLLIEKNTSKITIAEIARKANIDRKTFYLHYDSTDDIIKEVCQKKHQDFLQELKHNSILNDSFDVNAFLQTVNHMFEQDMELHKLIANHPDFRYFWEQIEILMIQSTTDMLAEIADLDREALMVYSRFIAAGVIDVYIRWLRQEIPLTLEEVGKLTSNMINCCVQSFLPKSSNTMID